MCEPVKLEVFDGRDNAPVLVFLVGAAGAEEPLDLTPVTRWLLELRRGGAGAAVDSQLDPGAFEVVAGTYDSRPVDALRLRLGQAGLEAGVWRARLTAFDGGHPNGQVLADYDELVITVA